MPIEGTFGHTMNTHSNSELPISDADRTEILGIYIELMRAQYAPAQSAANPDIPLLAPPKDAQDLRSQWEI